MNAPTLALLVVAVIFTAAFVRSALGFGDAVIAMPLLAASAGLKTAAPLVAFMGPAISILILAKHWQSADLRSAAKLIAASIAGIPLGIYLLTRLPEAPLRAALGIIVLLYGLFGLLKPAMRIENEKAGLPYIVGFIAGILGGAYNINGPPAVIYGMLKGWPPERFRATLQGYFLPTGLIILLGHGAAGLWTGQVLRLFAYSLPALCLGVWLGGKVHSRVPERRFRQAVYASLVIMGGFLVLRALLT
ncbi:MAG: sulfite exporter TauE/SafE family protein [Candidatus Aminicenantales bacterium]|jgi:uncharacterized membrane protein YfcA